MTWLNLENILSKISHTQKDKYYMITVIYGTWKYKFRETGSRIRSTKGWGRRETEILFNGHRVSVWDDQKLLKWTVVIIT